MKIVVFREKHANSHYRVQNEEDWYRVCMDVFLMRDGMNYFYEPQEKPEAPEKPDPMPEWVEDAYKEKLTRYKNALSLERGS